MGPNSSLDRAASAPRAERAKTEGAALRSWDRFIGKTRRAKTEGAALRSWDRFIGKTRRAKTEGAALRSWDRFIGKTRRAKTEGAALRSWDRFIGKTRRAKTEGAALRSWDRLIGLGLIAFVLGLTGWLIFGIAQAWLAPPPPAVGQVPPPLAVDTTDGRRFSLAELGKVTVIDFWRPDCPGCVGQTPILNRFQARFADQVEVIAVSDAEEEDVQRFVRARGIQYPVALDRDDWTVRFGVIAYPTLVIVGADGRVAAVHKRGTTEAALVHAVEGLLPSTGN